MFNLGGFEPIECSCGLDYDPRMGKALPGGEGSRATGGGRRGTHRSSRTAGSSSAARVRMAARWLPRCQHGDAAICPMPATITHSDAMITGAISQWRLSGERFPEWHRRIVTTEPEVPDWAGEYS